LGYRRQRAALGQEVAFDSTERTDDSFNDKRRRIGVLILCGVCFFGTVTSNACGQPADRSQSSGPTEIVVGVPEGNTPDVDLGIPQFLRLLSFESLTNNGADGRPIPRLADRWKWENGNRRLRVALRRNVFLHDGRAFTGEAAVGLVRAAITNRGNVSSFPALADVVEVSAAGNDLLFDLTRPSATLPDALTVPLDKGDNPVGTGPYRVVQQDDQTAALEAFDRYYQGKPTIDRVIVRGFDTLRPTWASLLRGELDVVYDVPADAVEFVRNEDIDVVSVPRWYQYHLTLNAHDARFRSPLVRKAFNLAVDRAGIIKKVLHGAGEPSAGPIYPRYWAFDASVPSYAFDPAGAVALLDSAGYRAPTASATAGPPARLHFTCLLPKGFTVWERIALEVQKDLLTIGVDMQFKVVPLREFDDLVFSGRFEAAFVDMISGPTPSRPYIWWRSTRQFKGLNVFGYENDEAERQFEILLRSTNEAAIRSATSKLQRIFYDDPPAVFVAWDARARAINRRFVVPDDSRDPMWTLWRWTVASPRKVVSAR
jgi:peptide/nickel transport system substrate-binding protein